MCDMPKNAPPVASSGPEIQLRASTNSWQADWISSELQFPKIRFCSKGHAIVGDNILIESPSVRCLICKRTTNGNLGEGVVRDVLVALKEGKTFHNLAGWKGDKYVGGKIVNTARLNRFCDENPKLGKRIRALAEKSRIGAISQPKPVIIRPTIVDASNDIMDVISAAVPHHLPRDLRDDAIQSIWLAVLEGRLKRSEIVARAYEFVRAEYKSNHNPWGPRSLDLPIYLDSNTTLMETVTRGLWD